MPDQKTMRTRCVGGFSVMWVLKQTFPFSVKIRIFAQKMTKLAFLGILGQALLANLVPCWWVGWWLWRASPISQDNYLLYIVQFRQVSMSCSDIIAYEFSKH